MCSTSTALAQLPKENTGFLGDIVNQVASGVGTQLDQLNHHLGNPVDHAIAAGADVLAPGAGSALETYWAAQRAGLLNGGNRPSNGQSPSWQNQPTMGNVCLTVLGPSSPGPFMPLGSPCFTWDMYGRQVWGTVSL